MLNPFNPGDDSESRNESDTLTEVDFAEDTRASMNDEEGPSSSTRVNRKRQITEADESSDNPFSLEGVITEEPSSTPSKILRKDPYPIRQCRIKDQVIVNKEPLEEAVSQKQPHRVPFTSEEIKKMWRFVNKQIRNDSGEPQKGLFKSSAAVWRVFGDKTDSDRSPYSLHYQYSKYFDILDAPFSTRTRLELYFALQIPVPMTFRIEVNKRYTLKLDADGRIEECESEKWADSSRTDDEEESSEDEDSDTSDESFDTDDEGDFERPYSSSETLEMWNHILQVVREQRDFTGKTPKLQLTPDKFEFWENFQKENGPERSLNSMAAHFILNMSRKVSRVPFDIETRANLYYALHIPITFDFYSAFKKVATVRLEPPINEQPFLQDYCYKDGSVIREKWSDLWLKDEEETARRVRERQANSIM